MRTNVVFDGAVTEPEANTNARTPLRSALEGAVIVTLVNPLAKIEADKSELYCTSDQEAVVAVTVAEAENWLEKSPNVYRALEDEFIW